MNLTVSTGDTDTLLCKWLYYCPIACFKCVSNHRLFYYTILVGIGISQADVLLCKSVQRPGFTAWGTCVEEAVWFPCTA